MTTTHDIDTAAAAPLPAITDDKQLRNEVHALAQKQLTLDIAAAKMKLSIEEAKQAFADATAETQSSVTSGLARIFAYAKEHRARLFPKKAKTHKILTHELSFRSSSAVKAPENAAEVVINLIKSSEMNISNLGLCDHSVRIAEVIGELEKLLRHPPAELNKEAVQAVTDSEVLELLKDNGISIETSEGFSLKFKFTPADNSK
jgi:hypothetical protein